MSLHFKNETYDPLRIVWLIIRKLFNFKKNKDGELCSVNYTCTIEVYKKYYDMKNKDINYDELKTYFGSYVLDIVLENKNKCSGSRTIHFYIEKDGITHYVSLIFFCDCPKNLKESYFVICEHKERKEPLYAIFNFSTKKTGAANEHMYGPMFEYSNEKHCGFLGRYEVVNNVRATRRPYQTKILNVSDDLGININKYLMPSSRRGGRGGGGRGGLGLSYTHKEEEEKVYIENLKEFSTSTNIWKQDTLILDSFRDRNNLNNNNKYTILFWSKCMTKLENLHGHIGYTYVVINSTYGGFGIPDKIMSRFKKLVKLGLKPVLPDYDSDNSDDSEDSDEEDIVKSVKDAEESEGHKEAEGYDEDEEDVEGVSDRDIKNYLERNRENSYFVQAVSEASPKEREGKYCYLSVERVDNNFSYRIMEYDGLEHLEISKKM